MILLQWCKTQIMCLMILGYVGIVFIKEGKNLNAISPKTTCNRVFDIFYIVSEVAVLFDGITACTVNYPDTVPTPVNLLMHWGMYVAYEIYVTVLFWYWVSATTGMSKRKWIKVLYVLPSLIAIGLTTCFISDIRFMQGKYTRYSMGISAYICFANVAIYCLLTLMVIITKYRYIPKRKRESLATTLVFIVMLVSLQIVYPEFLVSCIALMMVTLSIYINMENPSIRGLQHYHNEMVMGFATLVENRDDSTGGHIRRSSAYAVLIAENLRKNEKYKNQMTKDYIDNLKQAAPMHDVGKIATPDEILQKPGKLTDEEYEKMKEHPVIGGEIIQNTFGHLFDGEYADMAFQVARHHHEKWNGKGYPDGLAGVEIPLCARIMAVADVFDAVSAKRCYRDALPLSECYRIIEDGRGKDFDPDIVEAFMLDRKKIEEICHDKIHM